MNEQEMVISVPHSGTRSLRDHLGFDGYWHFGQNDPDIILFTGKAHIPVRDPFDVAMSWESRYPREQYKGAAEMLLRFDLMLEYVHNRPDTVFWLVDDLPIHEGKGPKHWAKDRKRRGEAARLDRSIALRRWYRNSDKAQTFYEKHFPKGFWWA